MDEINGKEGLERDGSERAGPTDGRLRFRPELCVTSVHISTQPAAEARRAGTCEVRTAFDSQ